MKRSFPLCNKSKQITSYILTCSQWKSVSGASNTLFESAYIMWKQRLSLIYSWLHNMTGQTAADEMPLNLRTAYDYYGFCREVCYVVVKKQWKCNFRWEKNCPNRCIPHIYQKIPQMMLHLGWTKTDLGIWWNLERQQ